MIDIIAAVGDVGHAVALLGGLLYALEKGLQAAVNAWSCYWGAKRGK